MPETRTLATIAQTVAMALPGYQKTLDKFKKDLDENPEYAFSWGNSAVEAGVRIRALQELKAYVEADLSQRTPSYTEEQWLTMVGDHFRREAMRMAQDMPSSTSHMSNLVDNYKRRYYAIITAWLSGEYFTSL